MAEKKIPMAFYAMAMILLGLLMVLVIGIVMYT